MKTTTVAWALRRWRFLVTLLALAAGQQSMAADLTDMSPDGSFFARVDTLIREWRFTEADAALRDALSDLQVAGDGSPLVQAMVEERRVRISRLRNPGRDDNLERALHVLAVKESVLGPASLETARSLALVGQVYADRNDFDNARRTLERSLRIMEASGSPVARDTSLVAYALGRTHYLADEFGPAKAWFARALAEQESAFGAPSPEYARTLQTLANLHTLEEDLPRAQAEARRSVELFEQALGAGNPQIANALATLGQALYMDGQFKEAKASFDRVASLLNDPAISGSVFAATKYLFIIDFLMETGDFKAAGPLADEVLAIYSREYGSDDARMADAWDGVAKVRYGMGDYAGAAENWSRVASSLETRQGTQGFDLALCLNNWAVALAAMSQYPEAERLLKRSLEIFSQSTGPGNLKVAEGLTNLADSAYEPQGKYAEAAEAASRALAILQASVDPDNYQMIRALTARAISDRGMGRPTEALGQSERALALQEKLQPSFGPRTARQQLMHARLLAESGASAAARDLAVRGETIAREHLRLTVQVAPQNDAMAYAAARQSGIDLLMTLATDARPDGGETERSAWDQVIRSRALVLDEMVRRHRLATAPPDSEMAHLADEMNQARARLARLVATGPGQDDTDVFSATVQSAREARDRAERAFAARSAEYQQALEQEQAGLEHVIQALPGGSALVAFVRFGRLNLVHGAGVAPEPFHTSHPGYAAFVLRASDRKPVFVPIGDAAAVDALVGRWRDAIGQEALSAGRTSSNSSAALRSLGTELRQKIWDPAAAYLADVQRVFIVPDGSLNLVDFVALPVGQDEYLVEHGPAIGYLSAERDLLTRAADAGADGGLLALSNPDFGDRSALAGKWRSSPSAATGTPAAVAVYRGQHSTCESFQSMRFRDLPASDEEAREIVRLWSRGGQAASLPASQAGSAGVLSLSAARARETTFKSQAAGRQVLHLATHGFFLGGQCESKLDSASRAPESTSSVSSVISEDPLLLAGLAMAGANRRQEAGPDEDDGILTADEISMLDLRGTQWAVLSACDTGLGEVRVGEGVFGLRRAFQLAGAHTVIMSLWPVEDEAARAWMASLYRYRFADREPTINAVHDASLEALRQRRARGLSTHPLYWAGFIAAGDWR
jgi:CHAT domain-containing protein